MASREGPDLAPEMGYRPTNKYLPPRPKMTGTPSLAETFLGGGETVEVESKFLSWVDHLFSR